MCWCVPVTHARPLNDGTTASRPPTRASDSMRQSNRESMGEIPTNGSPGASSPRACSTASRAEHPVPHGERSIFPGRIATAFRPAFTPPRTSTGAAIWQNETCDHSGFAGWVKPSCSFAARVILDSGHRDVPRLVRCQRKSERAGVHDHEAVAPVRGIHRQGPEPFDLQGGVQPVDEGGDVRHPHALDPPVAAGRHRFDRTARGFQRKPRLGLVHGEDAGLEQHRGDTETVGAGHRRGVLRLHDDEPHLRLRVLRRHQEVHVAEDSAARLVQHEVAQLPVVRDEPRLLPQRLARRRCDPADDDIADLAFGVGADDVDDAAGTHSAIRLPVP